MIVFLNVVVNLITRRLRSILFYMADGLEKDEHADLSSARRFCFNMHEHTPIAPFLSFQSCLF